MKNSKAWEENGGKNQKAGEENKNASKAVWNLNIIEAIQHLLLAIDSIITKMQDK